MNGFLCPQCESKLGSGQLTKAEVEASIKLVQLSQKIPQIEKFTLNSCQESYGNHVLYLSSTDIMAVRQSRKTPRFPIDIDKVIAISKDLRKIDLVVEFERK